MEKKWEADIRRSEIIGASITIGGNRLFVHHYIGCGDMWFCSYHGVFNKKELSSTTLSEAKCEALAMVQTNLQDALDQIAGVICR